jgi:Xaa-Pro aminopeptidase
MASLLCQDFVGLSFPTITASGPNGAVIHYHPTASMHHMNCSISSYLSMYSYHVSCNGMWSMSTETTRRVGADEMYLCDSGAQYRDGTTGNICMT